MLCRSPSQLALDLTYTSSVDDYVYGPSSWCECFPHLSKFCIPRESIPDLIRQNLVATIVVRVMTDTIEASDVLVFPYCTCPDPFESSSSVYDNNFTAVYPLVMCIVVSE